MDITPISKKFILQPGHIAIDKKWKNHNLDSDLNSFFNVVKVYDLKGIDFLLPNLRILYFPQEKLLVPVNVDDIKRSNCNFVIADRNTVTIDVFAKLQIDLLRMSINLFPVGQTSEVGLILYQLSLSGTMDSPGSSFRKTSKLSNDIQLELLQTIPGLGLTKAKQLLETFGTVQRMSFTSISDLIPIVGVSSAASVHRFFNDMVNT